MNRSQKILPTFADTGPAEEGLLDVIRGVGDFIGEAVERRKQDRETLFHANYANEAQRSAVEAYTANPTDMEGYKRAYREILGKIDVPLSQQARAGNTSANIEAQYFWTISRNQEQQTREELKTALDAEANGRIQSAIYFMDGQLADPLPQVSVGNQFRAATAMLFSTYADGIRVFTDGEVAGKTDQWNEQVLEKNMDRLINPEASVEALAQILVPEFDFTVAVETDKGPLQFQKKNLSPASQNRFNTAAGDRVASVIKKSSDTAGLDHAAQIWSGDVPFFGGDKRDKAALEKLAEAQIAATPMTGDNLQRHMDNCQKYLERYNFIPSAYARAIGGMVQSTNGRTAAMGATLLTRARAVSPSAVKVFDDTTVLRAELISAQMEGGATAENALNRANKALDPSGRAGMEFLQKSLRDLQKNSDKFYGKQVGPDVYGPNGVGEYRRMVDAFFLLTGGDRDAAVKTAQARMDSEYAETHIGADRHWRVPFFGAKRRKFKNTPEAVYGPNASGIINLDLEAMAPQISKMSGVPCDLDHIILVPTPETDRAVEMGEDPTWRILRSNGDGTSQFYTDGDGNPLIYSLSEGVQKAIYLADLTKAKIEKEENPSFGDALNPWLDRIITPMGRRAIENLPSWVLNGLGRAFGTATKFATGVTIPAGAMYELAKENNMRVAASVIGVIRGAWDDPGARKRELLDLLKFGSEPETPPKAPGKEWDAARRRGK
jgi:hypothetical protein